ncbi:hypothetical protein N7493_010987 [Penicillium malachiteum]|uniref:threonine synthase n=1 Tax=Penicillium malachiteum TaxID=1324776 RepID=A0AAD6MQN8_9EURO|nr:hypothetical protein N7493_010987 [Penicillium malachiteum]
MATLSQKYLSTRGAEYGLSFEEVVLQGLAKDGGLFIPEEIPSLPANWETEWADFSFEELAFQVQRLFIADSEIPSDDLRDIINRSYSTFYHPQRTPLVDLDAKNNLHLLELFHGQTRAFKDVALAYLGNLFEYFLVRKNEGKTGKDRLHLTVVGATSGDTGSAAISGLRGKKDVSVFILFPEGRTSPIQRLQMVTVCDANVHNLAVQGTFDNCQDTVKALFADPVMNADHHLAAVNSINWARILAQITYYIHSYFQLVKSPSYKKEKLRVVVPSGNFGDILAGWFAKQMGFPADKLVIATNENDILDRFFRSDGHYTKTPIDSPAQAEEVKETHSPAMDILVSSNFERLLWFLSYQTNTSSTLEARRQHACESVSAWLSDLKSKGGFQVPAAVLDAAKTEFESERVSNEETIATIRETFATCFPTNTGAGSPKSSKTGGYVLDPHTAVGIAASRRSIERNPGAHHISLSTAHPAKFASAVDLALSGQDGYTFSEILPQDFIGLEERETRVTSVPPGVGWEGIRDIVCAEVEQELQGQR